MTKYFSEETHPVNLALFRILLFSALIYSVYFFKVSWFAGFPEELRIVTPGLEWMAWFPVHPAWVEPAKNLFILFCVFGILGLWTRAATLICIVLGMYVLGIPHFFGKVDHFHHLMWFLILFAFAPAGDFFSIDSILQAIKRADRGDIEPPRPSRVYALPLRMAWLLMGVAYFWSGYWKLKSQGLGWITSDNLNRLFYEKWLDWGGWTPAFRIDQHFWISRFSAAGTLAFEIGFIVLVLFPVLRTAVFFAGAFIFHPLIQFFMRINFWYMHVFYPILLDWNKIFPRIGAWIFPVPLHLVYDGNCKLCRRTIAAFRCFDIFERVRYVNALSSEEIKTEGLGWIPEEDLMKEMHAAAGKKVWKGYEAYRVLACRIPILWPTLPFLYLWPVSAIGRRIYRKVADSRTCDVPGKAEGHHPNPLPQVGEGRVRAQMALGIFLILTNSLFGILKIHSWPFSVYPTFDWYPKLEQESVLVEALDGAGSPIAYEERKFREHFFVTRLRMLLSRILWISDTAERDRRLKGYWQLLAREFPKLREAKTVRFYKTTESILPKKYKDNPLTRELILEWENI